MGIDPIRMSFYNNLVAEVAFLYHFLINTDSLISPPEVIQCIAVILRTISAVPIANQTKELQYLEKIVFFISQNIKQIIDEFLENEKVLNETSLEFGLGTNVDEIEDTCESRKVSTKRTIRTKRANYPKTVTNILRAWLERNLVNPYPTEDTKKILGKETGLDMTQINNWFINARRRVLPNWTSESPCLD